MRLNYLCICLLIFLSNCLSQKAPQQKVPVASPTVESRSQKQYSENLRALIRQAQSGSEVPIEIQPQIVDESHPSDFQGRTGYFPDKIVIVVTSGVSKDYDEALLAHELFHIILRNNGFEAGVGHDHRYQIPELSVPDSEQSLNNLQTYINSCFPDELIDRETTKKGFKWDAPLG